MAVIPSSSELRHFLEIGIRGRPDDLVDAVVTENRWRTSLGKIYCHAIPNRQGIIDFQSTAVVQFHCECPKRLGIT